MSRTAIISDVHANLPALEAVLKDIADSGVSRIISLGDVAGYGPHINECCDLLRTHNIVNLMGNHDDYLLKDTGCPRSETATLALAYQARIITKDNLDWLAQSLLRLEELGASLVHAGWHDPLDEYMTDIPQDYFAHMRGHIFISGHTHVQGQWTVGTKVFANPGSVGQPRDGDPRAAYLTLSSDGDITLNRVVYDIKTYQNDCEKAGLPEKLWSCVAQGTRIGGGISQVSILE